MKTLILTCILSFFTLQAHAQREQPMFNTEEGKYGEERSRGDLAAIESRTAFELTVCQQSLKVFCPTKNADALLNLTDCRNQQAACHAMPTGVATRFISKYGHGSESASEEALPGIQKLLEGIQDFRFKGLHRKETIQEIADFAKVSVGKVKSKLIKVLSHYDQKRPPMLYVDFWGYFQQWYPQRPQFSYREDGTLDTITIAFRFCGMALKFVPEKNMIRDVFAQAIFSEEQLPQLASAAAYTATCDVFEKEWRESKKY